MELNATIKQGGVVGFRVFILCRLYWDIRSEKTMSEIIKAGKRRSYSK
jgi:hypothetical protein